MACASFLASLPGKILLPVSAPGKPLHAAGRRPGSTIPAQALPGHLPLCSRAGRVSGSSPSVAEKQTFEISDTDSQKILLPILLPRGWARRTSGRAGTHSLGPRPSCCTYLGVRLAILLFAGKVYHTD